MVLEQAITQAASTNIGSVLLGVGGASGVGILAGFTRMLKRFLAVEVKLQALDTTLQQLQKDVKSVDSSVTDLKVQIAGKNA